MEPVASQVEDDPAAPRDVDLEELVAESDLGGRHPAGPIGTALSVIAVAWSLFQLWYASPIPYMIGVGVFNDTEARVIHL